MKYVAPYLSILLFNIRRTIYLPLFYENSSLSKRICQGCERYIVLNLGLWCLTKDKFPLTSVARAENLWWPGDQFYLALLCRGY